MTAVLRSPRFLTGLVLLGVALRLWAYVANTSLWLDEILLSRNILELPLRTLLTQPLQLDQVAPRGFLLVEKLAVLAFGNSEAALRLFPFLCGVAGVFLFRRLAERVLDGLAVPFATALFAIGIPFIKYGAEVKQYEVDATAAILLMLLACDLRDRDLSTGRLVLLGLVGFVVTWFSQASVLVMGGIGLALGIEWLLSRERRTARALAITVPMWAVASVVAILVGRRSMTPSTKAFMDNFWAQGFLPRPFTPLGALGWLRDQMLSVFTDLTLLRYRWPAVFLVLAIVGLVALWRVRRPAALLLAGPLVVALTAAVAHQYPFRGRLMFYLLPSLLVAIAAGAEWVRRAAARLQPVLGGGLMATLLVPAVAALVEAPPPYEIEHHRAVLGYLRQHRQPGDVVYVLPLTRIGTMYYGPRYGLQPEEWTTGICDRKDTRAYLRDVDRFRGVRRLWLVSSGVRPFRVARPTMKGYLSTIGVRTDSVTLPSLTFGTVTIDRYDLSDTTRLRAASAGDFPAPAMPTDPPPGCRPWAQPSPLDGRF